MALRRVFVDSIGDGRAVVTAARAHHLARVVRLREGEQVEVSDGIQAWRAVAISVAPSSVAFDVLEVVASVALLPAIELQLALIKFPRLEWAVEKTTELGVATIVPVVAERSDRGLAKAAVKRADRWKRIAEEAAQQARRLGPPLVEAGGSIDEALARPADLRLILDFDGEALSAATLAALPTTGRVSILIGPEGGWTSEELERARAAGAVSVVLGSNILRAETAAVATVSIVNQLLRTVR